MVAENVTMLSAKVKHTFAEQRLPYPAMETMGDRIKMLRDAKEWRQEDLAERVGVTRAAVSQWERGETENIKIATYLRLCRELGTTPEYLVFGPHGDDRDERGRFGRKPHL